MIMTQGMMGMNNMQHNGMSDGMNGMNNGMQVIGVSDDGRSDELDYQTNGHNYHTIWSLINHNYEKSHDK